MANSWRIAPDSTGWISTLNSIGADKSLPSFAGPGGFNDPDMLLTSASGAARSLTPAHSRTQFNIWAILAAPLLIGGPIASLSAWDLETYLNQEVIAVDQDELAMQGAPLAGASLLHLHAVWGRRLSTGGLAAVFVNYNPLLAADVECDRACWANTPFPDGTVLAVRDLWAHGPAAVATVTVPDVYAVRVAHGGASAMLTFTPVELASLLLE